MEINLAAPVVVLVLAVAAQRAAPLEKVRAIRRSKNQERRYAMNSTICKRQNLAAQLFHTVMVQPLSVCVAVHR